MLTMFLKKDGQQTSKHTHKLHFNPFIVVKMNMFAINSCRERK